MKGFISTNLWRLTVNNNILVFDCETTGFYNPKVESTSPLQARVISLGAVLLAPDFTELACLNTLIKPNNWPSINPGAFAQHGLTKQQCELAGMELDEAMEQLITMANDASYKVAHNIEFDNNMLNVEWDHLKQETRDKVTFRDHMEVCTMESMTNICKLPLLRKSMYGGKFKWPKLKEAYDFCCPMGAPFKEHDALADVRACASIFKWMVQQGHYKLKECKLNPEYENAPIQIEFRKPTQINIGGTPNAV